MLNGCDIDALLGTLFIGIVCSIVGCEPLAQSPVPRCRYKLWCSVLYHHYLLKLRWSSSHNGFSWFQEFYDKIQRYLYTVWLTDVSNLNLTEEELCASGTLNSVPISQPLGCCIWWWKSYPRGHHYIDSIANTWVLV